MDIGTYQTMIIDRSTSVGLFLTNKEKEEVLLPTKYVPETYEIGDEIKVFIYLDSEEREIATTLVPKVTLGHFAVLKVKEVSNVGAWLDWGLEKDLLVPFREQEGRLEVGRSYLFFLDIDDESDRLFGSSKVEDYLDQEDMELEENQEVDIIFYRKTEIGYNVVVNGKHQGLVYENEIFQPVSLYDEVKGYVKKIRADGKLDIALQPQGYTKSKDRNVQIIIDYLQANNGFSTLHDKSSPEDIHEGVGLSKKAFKRAVGTLYKERKVTLEKDGIRWNSPPQESKDQ